MFEQSVHEKAAAVAALRACLDTADGPTHIEGLKAVEQLGRDLAHLRLALIANLDRSGEFDQRCVTTRAAISDLLGYHPGKARRMVAIARSMFPTTLDGQPVEPVMPATAAALGALAIDQAHADVIEDLLNSPTGRRLDPGVWGGAEAQLAEWAATCRPDELRRLGHQLLPGRPRTRKRAATGQRAAPVPPPRRPGWADHRPARHPDLHRVVFGVGRASHQRRRRTQNPARTRR